MEFFAGKSHEQNPMCDSEEIRVLCDRTKTEFGLGTVGLGGRISFG